MTKIAKIKTLNKAEEFIYILKDKDLLIYEDIQGSKIYVRYKDNKLSIKPKSLRNEDLNFIDLTVQNFYIQAYNFFINIPDYIANILNEDWWYCFEYFPDNQPANITYNRMPKNNLILNCVVKDNEYIYDYDEINEFAKLLNVEPLPIIFKGKLSAKQLEVIELYLNTNEKDLKYIFDEDNFAFFFYKILNPRIENSFLMNTDEFNDNLEKIIIKIDGKSKYSFEILNPLYNKMELINNTEHVTNYSLILLKFLEFSQLINLNKYKLTKITEEELYIEVISLIFNEYMQNDKENLVKWEFTVPSFFKENKFKINTNLLSNKETVKNIKFNDKLEYIFKCILGSFNKRRKKPIGIFNEVTLTLFNKFVEDLKLYIDKNLKINIEQNLNKKDLKNFKDFFNIKYSTDSQDNTYPDVYKEFGEKEEGEGKKKGKKDVKGKEMEKPTDMGFPPEKDKLQK